VVKVRKALISVSNKEGLTEFARGLAKLGVKIISTGGTAKVLRDAGLEAVDISDVTGFPEMLDGRVKTLHPKIHGGLLHLRGNEEHVKTIAEHEIEPIDMVVVNLYPFEQTVSAGEVDLEAAIEQIDIGGPSMVRSGAKNYKSVAVITNPAHYDEVLEEMNLNDAQVSDRTLSRLLVEAFEHTSLYDRAIHGFLQHRLQGGLDFPKRVTMTFTKAQDLRYGENPHQKAAFYRQEGDPGEASVAGAKQIGGKELSYNNIADLDAALNVVKEFADVPAVSIIKHANPCGAAVVAPGEGIEEAYKKAFDSDPVSAFGGIVAANRPVNMAMVEAIGKTFLECVAAPGFEEDALAALKAKANLRLLEVDFKKRLPYSAPGLGHERLASKKVTGGLLLQDRDVKRVTKEDCRLVSQRQPEDAEWGDLFFAWNVMVHVKSNAILMAKGGQTVGVGPGQCNRVGSVKIAAGMAGEKARGAVLASDAFFPFRDGVDAAARAGIKAIIQPGGSKNDDEVIAAANEHGIAMVFTGMRHFNH
jgi:phosphoribosylaminoimidazolecarboxamide formyltransferase/IMP cyclohydrolase